MTDLQEQIKSSLESSFEQFTGEKVIVEYVSDVDIRAKEIQKEIGVTMCNAYEANHYTGSFLPATDKSPSYILIQEDRKDNMDIMTAFHEMQHAVEYTMFLNIFFNKDRNKMVESKIYPTFQIYSEFSATRVGIANYLTFVEHSELSKKDFADCIIETYYNDYCKFNGIVNKYQLVIHTFQYLGVLYGVKDIIENFDIDAEINCIKYLTEFEELFSLVENFTFDIKWFEEFNKVAREFIG